MSTNELSVEITQEKDAAVQQLIDNLLAELDFLVDLGVDDRRRLAKMGRKNVDFVDRGYRHAEGTPRFLPSYITLEEFKKDVDFSGWIRKLEKKLDMIADKVKDTAMLAESEAFKTSRLYYNSVKAAANAGDEEAEPIARDLAVHYKKLGVRYPEEPVPGEPQQEEEPQP
jgi:hypothetical protein